MKNISTGIIFVVAMGFGNIPIHAQQTEQLTADKFEEKLKEIKAYTLLDVRTQTEYSEGHLANAILLDYYQKDFKEQLLKLDKNKPVFIYCAVGGRSNAAAGMLVGLGFRKVYDLQGGIRAWSSAQKAIVK